jgi:hypothetical protein
MSVRPAGTVFHEGDEVVLGRGTYQGTLGVFVRFKTDVTWADIAERNGNIRSHPVAWLDIARVKEPTCEREADAQNEQLCGR